MADANDEPSARIGWARAILMAAGIAVVGIAVVVYGTNAILTNVHSLNRPNRVGIATAVFFVIVFALAWALRWLQRRNVI